jgi:hypothetical protein
MNVPQQGIAIDLQTGLGLSYLQAPVAWQSSGYGNDSPKSIGGQCVAVGQFSLITMSKL